MEQPPKRIRLRHRLAFFATATLLLIVLATLPFTVTSAFQDILGSPEGTLHLIGPKEEEAPEHFNVHIDIIGLDELTQLMTFQVSIRRDFTWTSKSKERLVLFSLPESQHISELPPSYYVDFPTDEFCSTHSIQLPVHGQPLRYPFDEYSMRLGVLVQKIDSDGKSRIMDNEETKGRMRIYIREHLARQNMETPIAIDPKSVPGPCDNCSYLFVNKLEFHRPVYLKVLSVLLVLLVAAAASYAVFMRPFYELIVNSGALILGVWGIRAILVAGESAFVTAVDLSLSTVILFLLIAISVRALHFFKEKSNVSLPWYEYRPSNELCDDQLKESD